ncbi:MAG: glycosyltransferase family 39 protein [Candidatus Korobacteraceae bacterium]
MEKKASSPQKSRTTAESTPPTLRFSWSTGVAVGLIAVLAGALRVIHLSSRSLTLDEGFSLFLARADAATFSRWIWHSEFNMVLYYGLLRMWLHLNSGEFWARFLSVLCAVATVPVIYLVGVRLFGRGAALIACLLLAVHPFHLELSQQARSYALLVLLVSLSSWYFLRMAENASWANCVLYAAVSAAAIYSHFFAALVILAQWLSLALWQGPLPRRKFLQALATLAALLIPAGLYLLHSQRSHVAWIPGPSWRQALEVLYSLTLSKARCLVYLTLWGIALWCSFRQPRKRAWAYQFVAAWLLVPLAITGLAGLVQPLWVPRFLAVCLPASVLFAAAGVMQLTRWSRAAGVLALFLVMFYSGSAMRFYLRHPEFSVDWRTAITYLLPRLQPGDEVVMDPYVRYTFDYYRQAGSLKVPPVIMANSLATSLPAPAPRNVWVIASVLVNPEDKSSGPEATQTQVQAFLDSHGKSYCAQPPRPETASVEVWQLQRCGQP